jgi:pimeloyl-ACP methyl ester carboxylesterase
MSRGLRVILFAVLGVFALGAVARQVMYAQAQRAGFEPQPPGHARPTDLGMRYEPMTIRSGDRSLESWWIPADGADSGAVIVFPGNADDLTDWLAAARLLHAHHLDLMFFNYSGYGRSTGRPSIDTVVEDGVNALHAFDARVARGERRTGAGLSLGAAVLMQSFARDPGSLDAVALMEPFSSGREVAVHDGMLPRWVAPLMPDVLDNVQLARRLRVPLVVVHSRADRHFPVAFGEAVARAAGGPCRLVVLDGYEHAAARERPDETYWAPVVSLAQGPGANGIARPVFRLPRPVASL